MILSLPRITKDKAKTYAGTLFAHLFLTHAFMTKINLRSIRKAFSDNQSDASQKAANASIATNADVEIKSTRLRCSCCILFTTNQQAVYFRSLAQELQV